MHRIKVSIKDPMIRQIVTATFPEYRGRKLAIEAQRHPLEVRDFGGGGTYSKFVFLNLATMKTVPAPVISPFNNSEAAKSLEAVVLPEGIAAIEHAHFCGKDVGITIHVNPNNVTKLLEEAK